MMKCHLEHWSLAWQPSYLGVIKISNFDNYKMVLT